MTSHIHELAGHYQPVSLEEMDRVKLMDRVESKFLFNLVMLPLLLKQMETGYRILETSGSRVQAYQNIYFDTPELKLYHLHRQGNLNRFKIRYRRYCDSDLCFFEVKFKNNKGRTIKRRTRQPGFSTVIEGKAETLLRERTPFDPCSLAPVLQVNYNRMTFVNMNLTERITLDTGLTFRRENDEIQVPGLCIAEVKQEKSNLAGFPCLMHRLNIPPMSVSKFCLGIIHMYPGIRQNNFKPKLLSIQKILKHGN